MMSEALRNRCRQCDVRPRPWRGESGLERGVTFLMRNSHFSGVLYLLEKILMLLDLKIEMSNFSHFDRLDKKSSFQFLL